jgi:hypothetical protein
VFAHLNLANLLSRYGRGASAIPELEAAEALAEASGDAELLARPRIQRAYELHVSGNDSRRAYRLARDVEAQVFPGGHYELRAACVYTLARITEDLGPPRPPLSAWSPDGGGRRRLSWLRPGGRAVTASAPGARWPAGRPRP